MVAHIENWLWLISSLAIVALLIKFLHEGLWRRYQAFFAYLLVEVGSAAVLSLIKRPTVYVRVFFGSEFILWAMYLLVTLEIYRVVLQSHPGIARFGRHFVQIAFAVSVGVALLSLALSWNAPVEKSQQILHNLNVLRQTFMSSAVALLLLVISFMVWFPIRLNRNTFLYCIGCGTFFVTKTLTLLIRNLFGPDLNSVLSCVTMGVWTACNFFWLFLLSRQGEELPLVLRVSPDPLRQRHLVEQLDAINASLLRVARK